MDRKLVGQSIKEARKKKGMTQKELADAIGKKEVSIGKYETGKVNIPIPVINEIAQVLDVTPATLLADSWEAEFNPDGKLSDEVKLIEQIKFFYGSDAVQILEAFCTLNDQGKQKVLEHMLDWAEIPKYQK